MIRSTFLAACVVLLAALQGCGSSQAESVVPAETPAAANPTVPAQNFQGLAVQRPATATDAWGGGISVQRDASAVAGGTYGFVNAGLFNRTTAGADLASFEWAHLSILDNYARAGENVAIYAQANKFGTGPTWAAVSEVADTTGSSTGTVTHEFDMWTSGPDSGARIGLDVVVGDARRIRGLGGSDQAEGSVGLRIGASSATPYARWTRGVQLTGGHTLGIDTSTATISSGTALRIAEGQAISLDATDSTRLHYQAGRVSITSGGRPVFEIDTATGDLYKMGQRIL